MAAVGRFSAQGHEKDGGQQLRGPGTPQAGVLTFGNHQLLMTAELDNPAVDHDRNPVGIMCGMQPMRNCDDGTVFKQRGHRTLKMSSRMRVDQ
jgi:hypothetical protein